MAAERALEDPTVLGAVEDGAPETPARGPGRAPPAHGAAAIRGLLSNLPPTIVSRKCVCQRVARVDMSERGGDPALGHHRMGLAQQRLAHEPDGAALVGRLDRRSESRAAGPDDEDVVGFEPLGLSASQRRMAGSWNNPSASDRTYTSASVTDRKLAQAQPM